MQSEYPLFPLPTTLLPHGKMPLQIFEQRYLKLVKQCMREGSTFGVIQLVKGSEVMKDGRRVPPVVAERGTVAQIVDWDQLPNGLLGITLQGKNTFTASNLRVAEDGLVLCDAEFVGHLGGVGRSSGVTRSPSSRGTLTAGYRLSRCLAGRL
jgi:Lon protease-like protein